MKTHPSLERSFRKLYGKPCWNVKQGYGTSLTLEFGEPHLHVREPRKVKRSRRWAKHWARRLVTVCGDWQLWIYCADWAIYDKRERIADADSSDSQIAKGASILNGQALQRASFQYRGCRSVFEFDLGGRLVVEPWPPEDVAWILREPNDKYLSLRADKTFSHEAGNVTPDRTVWKPIWSK